jgi:hypothetical protein
MKHELLHKVSKARRTSRLVTRLLNFGRLRVTHFIFVIHAWYTRALKICSNSEPNVI